MSSKIMTISIPDRMYRHVKDRVSGDTYNSVSEYFRELIRMDVRMMQRAQNALPAQQAQPPRPPQPVQPARPPQLAQPQPVIERAQHARPARPPQTARPQPVIERPKLASAARRPLTDRDIESLLRH